MSQEPHRIPARIPPPDQGPPEPPRRISRASAVYWLFRGMEARMLGHSLEALPFDPDESVTQFFLAHWWLKGWRRGP